MSGIQPDIIIKWKKRFVYADNAATTRVLDKALSAAMPYFNRAVRKRFKYIFSRNERR